MSAGSCSCGNATDHVVARRSTADGKHVYLWSDGSLTWALGFAVKGSARPRSAAQRQRAMRAGWLVMGDVCLYDSGEVTSLVVAARWAADRDGLPGTMRARLRTGRRAKRHWVTLEADCNGKPITQVWKMNRIQHPGVAIWRERGWYTVCHEVGRTGTFRSSGIRGRSLAYVLRQITNTETT